MGFKHSCLYSHLETVAHQDLPADVAVWDCWFTNQKKLYDAQSQEPDEMRRLHLANQQWVQEERKRGPTQWLKVQTDGIQGVLKIQTDAALSRFASATDVLREWLPDETDVVVISS